MDRNIDYREQYVLDKVYMDHTNARRENKHSIND